MSNRADGTPMRGARAVVVDVTDLGESREQDEDSAQQRECRRARGSPQISPIIHRMETDPTFGRNSTTKKPQNLPPDGHVRETRNDPYLDASRSEMFPRSEWISNDASAG